MSAPRWIDTRDGLEELVDVLLAQSEYAFDTEFHRERSYYPHLALMQVAWDGQVAVVDPLAVDPAPFRRLLEGPGLAICHSAEQDLEVMLHACGAIPRRLFDTQIAAAFLGLGFASLSKLVAALVGARLPKGDRLTDWTRRPLDDAQLAYAASDVEHLLDMAGQLRRRAERSGTIEWIEEECERVRTRVEGPPDPETSWWRIKGSRSLKGSSRGVAQEVSAWRERLAAARDIPPRFVLSDLALAGIAQRSPKNLEELKRVRGLDARALRAGMGDDIVAAVKRGLSLRAEQLRLPPRGDAPLDELGPTVALGLALVARIAEEHGIEPSVLATRADIHSLAAGRRSSRLASGWRGELVGGALRDLLAGRSALAGDGKGGVRLISLSGDAVANDGKPDSELSQKPLAGVVELADTEDLKSSDG